ncbi:MAG: NAD(P) transhydrogenase subunit alpha [Alphaproteobacteria bacterium]
MKIAIPRERRKDEQRIALSLETAQKYIKMGFEVYVEKKAGVLSGIEDEQFSEIGVQVVEDVYEYGDIILKIWAPLDEEISKIKKDSVIIANFDYTFDTDKIEVLKKKNITCFALNLVPRISRAQSMDILSSQSNLAGYRAVIDAVAELNKAVPLMMTAAGTVAPIRFLILGAGVAGLQAIATAKRLGGIVFASDVRPQVKEQVESLGGKFVEVKSDEVLETTGGYAKETSADYQKKQNEAVAEQLKKTDVLITTALIPNKKAPVLVTKEMLTLMPSGSIAMDMAAEFGGNIEGSVNGKCVKFGGIKVFGESNLASKLSASASKLFAQNVLNFLIPMYQKESKTFQFNFSDEIVEKTCLCCKGEK